MYYLSKQSYHKNKTISQENFMNHVAVAIVLARGGGEGQGKQRRGLRTKALMLDLGTRLEC